MHGNGNLAAVFDELQQQLRDVSKDIVRLSHQLLPSDCGRAGVVDSSPQPVSPAADDKRTVFFVQNENLPPLPDEVSLPLYRIAQESLQNALIHSGASYIHVELSASATMFDFP